MVDTGAAVTRRSVRVRLTRRGRAAVLAFFLLVNTASGVLLATASRADGPTFEPVSGATTVVRDADTLWSIAGRHAPSRPTWDVIAEIRELNRLTGSTLRPGQVLVLPAGR